MDKKVLKKMLISFISLLIIFITLIILLICFDRRINIYTGEKIGLYSFNNLFFNNKYNYTYDIISDFYLYFCFLIIIILITVQLVKFLKYKNILYLDFNFITLLIFLFIIFTISIIFDKLIIINYRPIITNGILEGSFPSTHITIITFVYLSTISFLKIYERTYKFKQKYYILIIINIILSSFFRLMSGMHWMTDIIGGLLLGTIMFLGYTIIINMRRKKMFDNLNTNVKKVETTLNGKQLIIKDMYPYIGPLTMQYLPNGGIQMIRDNQMIIKTNLGFLATNNIEYDGKKITANELANQFPYLVNTVLPN